MRIVSRDFQEANFAGRERISTAESDCAVYVVPTDEDRMIARHARAVLGA